MTHYKLFIPKDAANTKYHGITTIAKKLQERFADKFGGYTKTESSGGWLNDDRQLIEEKVIVYDIFANNSEDAFIKANANWLLRNTGEDEVMFTKNHDKYLID